MSRPIPVLSYIIQEPPTSTIRISEAPASEIDTSAAHNLPMNNWFRTIYELILPAYVEDDKLHLEAMQNLKDFCSIKFWMISQKLFRSRLV